MHLGPCLAAAFIEIVPYGILALGTRFAADGPLETLRESVAELLDQTTVDDARAVYRAIRTAEPAGLRLFRSAVARLG